MKFILALVASLASALQIGDTILEVTYYDYDDTLVCHNEWTYEFCSRMYWRDLCDWEKDEDSLYQEYMYLSANQEGLVVDSRRWDVWESCQNYPH